MTGGSVSIDRYDKWLKDDSDVAALVMRQWLQPVEGKGAVIFPPTYAKPEGKKEGDWIGYNIDCFGDGSNVCLIDSVGSQANRMEPIFKRDRYRHLVPEVVIKAGQKRVNLLDAGHRAADAIVRYSDKWDKFQKAFVCYQEHGNAEPLAKIAPTSIVFGAWDSRETQAKLPRVVRSVIRAYGVEVLHRSAQYIPPIDYVAEGLVDESESNQKRLSEEGLAHAPAPWTHGGILVRGEIRRDAAVNLEAIRALAAASEEATTALRRYILGLALIALTAPQETSLREGCQLVPDPERPAEWEIVKHDGQRQPLNLSHDEALAYAEQAAREFGVGEPVEAVFDKKKAKDQLGKSKKDSRSSRPGASTGA